MQDTKYKRPHPPDMMANGTPNITILRAGRTRAAIMDAATTRLERTTQDDLQRARERIGMRVARAILERWLPLAFGVLLFFSIFIGYQQWVQPTWNNLQAQWHTGDGRIVQLDANVGHGGVSHFIAETKEKIINLLSVAEDARDETTRQLYRERLVKLERDIRETEAMLARLSNSTERNHKLLTALDKFEAWALSQQQFLMDPTYEITKEDKRAVLFVLGAKATVWPSEGYPQRIQFELCPPDVQRFCDFSFQ